VRPVDQTSYGALDGNCFSACIASILEVPLTAVPYFWGPGQDQFIQWLEEQGHVSTFLVRAVGLFRAYPVSAHGQPGFLQQGA